MKKKNRILIYQLLVMGLVLIYTNSCKKDSNNNDNNSNNSSTTLAIGQSYQGGIIAYILQSGDPRYDANVKHGLIAAPSDQSTGIFWHATNDGILTGATGTAIGTGNENTNAIIALYGTETNAARICYDLVLGGYSDWYLPSKDELDKLVLNKIAIGGFADVNYWSSTEVGNGAAWFQDFGNGDQVGSDKPSTYYVRAVRAF